MTGSVLNGLRLLAVLTSFLLASKRVVCDAGSERAAADQKWIQGKFDETPPCHVISNWYNGGDAWMGDELCAAAAGTVVISSCPNTADVRSGYVLYAGCQQRRAGELDAVTVYGMNCPNGSRCLFDKETQNASCDDPVRLKHDVDSLWFHGNFDATKPANVYQADNIDSPETLCALLHMEPLISACPNNGNGTTDKLLLAGCHTTGQGSVVGLTCPGDTRCFVDERNQTAAFHRAHNERQAVMQLATC